MFETSLTKMQNDKDSGYVVDRSEMYFFVLMHFSMPQMRGDEATEIILKMYKNLQISE